MADECEPEALRRASTESRTHHERGNDFLRFLEDEVWPKASYSQFGRRLSREEEDNILGSEGRMISTSGG